MIFLYCKSYLLKCSSRQPLQNLWPHRVRTGSFNGKWQIKHWKSSSTSFTNSSSCPEGNRCPAAPAILKVAYHVAWHNARDLSRRALLCIGQIEASTCPPPPGQPPGIWLFWKLLFKFPPTRAKMPFKCPTLGSIQVIKCPHPGDISQAQKW